MVLNVEAAVSNLFKVTVLHELEDIMLRLKILNHSILAEKKQLIFPLRVPSDETLSVTSIIDISNVVRKTVQYGVKIRYGTFLSILGFSDRI